ncbi:MAG: hypothetical protein AAFR77_09060 [Cyanobacteria bacterium J06631_2]
MASASANSIYGQRLTAIKGITRLYPRRYLHLTVGRSTINALRQSEVEHISMPGGWKYAWK